MFRRLPARKKLRARRQVCANVFGLGVEFSAPGQDELRAYPDPGAKAVALWLRAVSVALFAE